MEKDSSGEMTKLNLGCGPHILEGWINVDYSLGARIAKTPVLGALAGKVGMFNVKWDPRIHLQDLTKPLQWESGSVDFIYSSHTLEHLRREDGERLIAECVRVLKPGGVLRIVVPCLERILGRYRDGDLPADQLVDELMVLSPRGDMSLVKRVAFGLFDDGHTHKCMYDHAALEALMRKQGLEASRRLPFDSAIPDIRDVEVASRSENQVVVEGRKPGAR